MRVSLVSGGVGWGESARKFVSSEGTLSRCPEFARFTIWRSRVGALAVLGTVIQLLGLGIGLGLAGVPPLKVVVGTRLAPWEARVKPGYTPRLADVTRGRG